MTEQSIPSKCDDITDKIVRYLDDKNDEWKQATVIRMDSKSNKITIYDEDNQCVVVTPYNDENIYIPLRSTPTHKLYGFECWINIEKIRKLYGKTKELEQSNNNNHDDDHDDDDNDKRHTINKLIVGELYCFGPKPKNNIHIISYTVLIRYLRLKELMKMIHIMLKMMINYVYIGNWRII